MSTTMNMNVKDLPQDEFLGDVAPSGRTRVYLIIGGVVLGVLILAFAVLATIFGWWNVILDIVLVIAALTSGAMLGILAYAVFNLLRTINEMRKEIMPVIQSLKTTTDTVRETATSASKLAVQPAIRATGLVVGASSLASVVLRGGKAKARAQARQARRHEIEQELVARGEL